MNLKDQFVKERNMGIIPMEMTFKDYVDMQVDLSQTYQNKGNNMTNYNYGGRIGFAGGGSSEIKRILRRNPALAEHYRYKLEMGFEGSFMDLMEQMAEEASDDRPNYYDYNNGGRAGYLSGGQAKLDVAAPFGTLNSKDFSKLREEASYGGRMGYAMGGSEDMPGANSSPVIQKEAAQVVELIRSIDDPDRKINLALVILMKMGENAVPILKEALSDMEFGAMAAKLNAMPDDEIAQGVGSLSQTGLKGPSQMARMGNDDEDEILEPDAMQTSPDELIREIQSRGAVETARAPSQEGIMSMMRG